MRAVVAFVVACVAATAASAGQSREAACAERLEATLHDMQTRALLKEEHATALMWLRMDAEEALEDGDADLCHAKLDTVDLLLGR